MGTNSDIELAKVLVEELHQKLDQDTFNDLCYLLREFPESLSRFAELHHSENRAPFIPRHQRAWEVVKEGEGLSQRYTVMNEGYRLKFVLSNNWYEGETLASLLNLLSEQHKHFEVIRVPSRG